MNLTHIAEDLVLFGVAVSKLIDIVSKLPTPLLAAGARAARRLPVGRARRSPGSSALLDPLRSPGPGRGRGERREYRAMAEAGGERDRAGQAQGRRRGRRCRVRRISPAGLPGPRPLSRRYRGHRLRVRRPLELGAQAEKAGQSVGRWRRALRPGAALVEKWGCYHERGVQGRPGPRGRRRGYRVPSWHTLAADTAEAGTGAGLLGRMFASPRRAAWPARSPGFSRRWPRLPS